MRMKYFRNYLLYRVHLEPYWNWLLISRKQDLTYLATDYSPGSIIASVTFLYRKRLQALFVSAQISLLRFGRAPLIDECEAFKATKEALGTCCSLIKKDTPQHKVFWFRFYLRSKKVRRSPLFSKPIVLSDILMSQQEVKQVLYQCRD